jgi:hypothetical protein
VERGGVVNERLAAIVGDADTEITSAEAAFDSTHSDKRRKKMCDLWQITPTIAREARSNRLSGPTVAEKRILPAKKAGSGLPQNRQASWGSVGEFATAMPGSVRRG